MVTNWATPFSHYKNRGFRWFLVLSYQFVFFVSSYLPPSQACDRPSLDGRDSRLACQQLLYAQDQRMTFQSKASPFRQVDWSERDRLRPGSSGTLDLHCYYGQSPGSSIQIMPYIEPGWRALRTGAVGRPLHHRWPSHQTTRPDGTNTKSDILHQGGQRSGTHGSTPQHVRRYGLATTTSGLCRNQFATSWTPRIPSYK